VGFFVDVPGEEEGDNEPNGAEDSDGDVEYFSVFAGVDESAGENAVNITDFAFCCWRGMGFDEVNGNEKAENYEDENDEALGFEVHLLY